MSYPLVSSQEDHLRKFREFMAKHNRLPMAIRTHMFCHPEWIQRSSDLITVIVRAVDSGHCPWPDWLTIKYVPTILDLPGRMTESVLENGVVRGEPKLFPLQVGDEDDHPIDYSIDEVCDFADRIIWIVENIQDSWGTLTYLREWWYFTSAEDCAAFKLRWL